MFVVVVEACVLVDAPLDRGERASAAADSNSDVPVLGSVRAEVDDEGLKQERRPDDFEERGATPR